jgi:hypothetical protein
VLRFIEYVNEGDLAGVASLISEDVKFADIRGRVYMEKGSWQNTWRSFPTTRYMFVMRFRAVVEWSSLARPLVLMSHLR